MSARIGSCTMNKSAEPAPEGYEAFYREFDSPLMQELRRQAYGEDIGQHSWVTADDMRADILRMKLTSSSRLLDLGCGPCGPLLFAMDASGCRGTGAELSAAALRAGQARAERLGLGASLEVREIDLNEPLPFQDGAFDGVMSLDVVLHLRDRSCFFGEVARLLSTGGKFLFTDAGVVTGAVSNEEIRARSPHGYTQFVVPGWNEQLLESAGLRLLHIEDRTSSVLRNATGRLAAVEAHRAELEQVQGAQAVADQLAYLSALVEVSRRRALSRFMYLAERASTI
jgi:cyclopropane fatty-acyl-phospholipid synthase-like methyltransferase